MKKTFAVLIAILIAITVCVASCDSIEQTTTIQSSDNSEVDLGYTAYFYKNNGDCYFKTKGSAFDVKPNKVKEYYYSDDGTWTYRYTMSSVLTITIDGHEVEDCGDTIIFADNSLEASDMSFNTDVITEEYDSANSGKITDPGQYQFVEYWALKHWYISKLQNNQNVGPRAVIIRTQDGEDISMYTGDKVEWTVEANLPKTTKLLIDGKALYIVRAQYTIVDMDLLDVEETE